jgi:CRISPR-associated protein Cas2
MRHRYLVSYDICDKKRLRRVFKKMNGYGDAVQLSVFRCELSAKERELMIGALDEIIHHDQDQVMIVDLGPARGQERARIKVLGRKNPPLSNDPLVV